MPWPVHPEFIDLARQGGARFVYYVTERLEAEQLLGGATAAALHRIRVQDFSAEKSGGYAPPKRTVDLLLDRPELKATKPRSGGWPDAQLHFG
ncbi:hypothetical protein ACFYMW_30240 [Streptomyces sp. NPDC006692]|uniref:hypothetical protein n=1 Tax=unclassified Streptomyces TaxID=2593676 RepID=UPI0036C456B2